MDERTMTLIEKAKVSTLANRAAALARKAYDKALIDARKKST